MISIAKPNRNTGRFGNGEAGMPALPRHSINAYRTMTPPDTLNPHLFTLRDLLTLMAWTAESGYRGRRFWADWIDRYCADEFSRYPVLAELSLAADTQAFLDAIADDFSWSRPLHYGFWTDADGSETPLGYYEVLAGFIWMAARSGSRAYADCRTELLDLADAGLIAFDVYAWDGVLPAEAADGWTGKSDAHAVGMQLARYERTAQSHWAAFEDWCGEGVILLEC